MVTMNTGNAKKEQVKDKIRPDAGLHRSLSIRLHVQASCNDSN